MNRAERRAARKKLSRQQRHSRDQRDLTCLAYHEAAHAVIATALDLEVHNVSIRGRQATFAHTEYETPEFFSVDAVSQVDTSHPDAPVWLEAKAICGLAGPRMHELVLLNLDQQATLEDEGGWEIDQQQVEFYCACLCEATGRDAEEVVNTIEDRARELVIAHGDTIAEVAQVLSERGNLTGSQLREIVAANAVT